MDKLQCHYEQSVKLTRDVSCEESGVWSLDYYLQTYTSSDEQELYGIKVCKRSGNEVLEENETFAISDCRVQTTTMLEYLANGTVPPSVLLEMVDEWFSNEVWGQSEIVDEQIPTLHMYHMGG